MIHPKASFYFLLLSLAAAFAVLYFVIKPFFGPLILALVLAYIFQSVYRKLLSYMQNKEGLAALLTMIVAIFLVLLPLVFLGIQIFRESEQLYKSLTDQGRNSFIDTINIAFENARNSSLIPVNFDVDFNSYLQQGLSMLVQSFGSIFSSLARITLNFFVFLIAFYYLLRDGRKLKEYLVKLSPLDDRDDEMIANRIKKAVSAVVKGNILIGLIQGTLTGIGFALFGIPNPVLWGSAAAIAALVPGVGTAIVITPAIVYLFVIGNNLSAFGILIWGVAAVGLVDNFLGPRLVGRGMRLHPLAAFLAVLGGLSFFGPLGVFLGPLVLAISLALVEIYFSLTKKSDSKI